MHPPHRTRTASTGAYNPQDGTYHRDLGLPCGSSERFAGTLRPFYTVHALRAALSDRYGEFTPPAKLVINPADVVEVTYEAGAPVKAVVRLPYNARFDLVLVINRPANGAAVVKTVWLNERIDNHRTLDRSKYVALASEAAAQKIFA